MSREEAAAKALFQHDNQHAPSLTLENAQDHLRNDYLAGQTAALASADAHDAANGIHRVTIDDATVERAARTLHELNPSVRYFRNNAPVPWEQLTQGQKQEQGQKARAVLAAAVEADQ